MTDRETIGPRRVVDPNDGSWRRCRGCFVHRTVEPTYGTPVGDVDGVVHLIAPGSPFSACGIRFG